MAKDYIAKKMSEVESEAQFSEFLNNYLSKYISSVSDVADTEIARYISENFDRCTETQYHSYAINRYLNDFKYQNQIVKEEKGDIKELINQIND